MPDEFYIDERQEKQLDEISLILREMDRANMNRDNDKQKYCISVETIILNLPRSIKYKAYTELTKLGLVRGHYESITPERLVLYDDLNNYIRDQLEKQKQMWVKKETKTFE